MKFTVKNVFTGKYGTKFNLTLELDSGAEVTIYGCRIVEGRKGDFIGWPSYEGKDGKYWNHVYVDIGPKDVEDIISEVRAQADDSKGGKRCR